MLGDRTLQDEEYILGYADGFLGVSGCFIGKIHVVIF